MRRPQRDNSPRIKHLQATRQYENAAIAAAFARRLFFTWLKVAFLAAAGVCTVVVLIIGWRLSTVPNLAYLHDFKPIEAIEIYDRNDELICSVKSAERRKLIPLARVSPHMVKALLTAEDRNFYEHEGINPLSIARAALANAVAGQVVEGGSTITQQLVKNLFFHGEKRTFDLKIAEAVVAWQIEQRYSKDKILELYLNQIYFGNGAYGIEQAARRYFAKCASDLSIAECAYLAGIIRAPNLGASAAHRPQTLKRQQALLNKMHEYKHISDLEWLTSKMETLRFARLEEKESMPSVPRYPYYVNYVLDLVRDRYSPNEIQRHGLKVYTNLDPAAQRAAESVLSAGIASAPAGINQGALVSINVSDAAVLALVGGVGNYLENQWNCATNPHTVGSVFKPFVYLAAFNAGLVDANSYVDDTPFVVAQGGGKEYKPQNYDRKFLGTIKVSEALAFSRNIPALRIAQAVGINNVISTARAAGIESAMPPELALALGCSAASPLEVANAYATLARGGQRMRPRVIRRIEDRGGRVLVSFRSYAEHVFDKKCVAQIVDLLQDVVAAGTGTQARLGDRPVAGKTGTADQARDLWFVGFTPDLVTAVWAGNSGNRPVGGGVTGGSVMARIWRDYNRQYYARHRKPPGCFIACTRLVGDYSLRLPKEREDDSRKRAPIVIYRPEDEYNHHGRVRTGSDGSIVRSEKGVTEYRW